MTPAEHRAEADRLVSLCYTAEPMCPDEVLPDITISGGERYANMLAAAQVHATLALAPQPPAKAVEPPRRWQLDQLHPFLDSTGGTLAVVPAHGLSGAIVSVGDEGLLFEDPATLRALASLLTAHADRMEKP